jgi:hypothetical protein
MASKIMGQRPATPLPQAEGIASEFELRNCIEKKLLQLDTLLNCCYGNSAEWFDEIGKDNRDVLLWIAADLAGDIRVTHRSLMNSREVSNG